MLNNKILKSSILRAELAIENKAQLKRANIVFKTAYDKNIIAFFKHANKQLSNKEIIDFIDLVDYGKCRSRLFDHVKYAKLKDKTLLLSEPYVVEMKYVQLLIDFCKKTKTEFVLDASFGVHNPGHANAILFRQVKGE
jgi:hypothetical protein